MTAGKRNNNNKSPHRSPQRRELQGIWGRKVRHLTKGEMKTSAMPQLTQHANTLATHVSPPIRPTVRAHEAHCPWLSVMSVFLVPPHFFFFFFETANSQEQLVLLFGGFICFATLLGIINERMTTVFAKEFTNTGIGE